MTKDWGFAFPLFYMVGMRKTGDKVSITAGIGLCKTEGTQVRDVLWKGRPSSSPGPALEQALHETSPQWKKENDLLRYFFNPYTTHHSFHSYIVFLY